MKKRELAQILRAAGQVAHDREFFRIGSQAVHAYCRRPPTEVLLSQECDLYPKNRPRAALLIDRELGRRSKFAREHGFYADVVTPELASLPLGWERRLRPFRAAQVTAFCIEAHDLVISKLAAGRLKDLEFVNALLQMKLVHPRTLRRRIRQFPIEADRPWLLTRLQSVMADLHHRKAR